MNRVPATAWVSKLCPTCGLCCNGVLFADVKLQPGDEAGRLIKLGLPVTAARRPFFPQPCACFDGKLCRIYPDRPAYCRAFECGLLKRVQSGELSLRAGSARIALAKRQAGRVLRLLRELGDRDEDAALTARYIRVMSEPVDLSGPKKSIKDQGRLMRAMESLMQVLQREFLE